MDRDLDDEKGDPQVMPGGPVHEEGDGPGKGGDEEVREVEREQEERDDEEAEESLGGGGGGSF